MSTRFFPPTLLLAVIAAVAFFAPSAQAAAPQRTDPGVWFEQWTRAGIAPSVEQRDRRKEELRARRKARLQTPRCGAACRRQTTQSPQARMPHARSPWRCGPSDSACRHDPRTERAERRSRKNPRERLAQKRHQMRVDQARERAQRNRNARRRVLRERRVRGEPLAL